MIYKSLTLEEAQKHIEEMKQELRKSLDGKFMIRRDRSYKGLEQNGVWSFNVYYDTPTRKNKEAIKVAAYNQGLQHSNDSRVIGGSYGYVFRISTP